jgi:circadian clock protein KaiC
MENIDLETKSLSQLEPENTDITATGVSALDTILGGGIPAGRMVLLSGASGTGKTLLSMEWLCRGHQHHNTAGLYLTLNESITAAADDLTTMPFYDDIDTSQIHFANLRSAISLLNTRGSILSKDDVEQLVRVIEDIAVETNASRVVIDSITAIAYLMAEEHLIQYFLFRLKVVLNQHDVTTFVISEVPDNSQYSVFGLEEFVSDMIISLDQHWDNGECRRSLTVVKHRNGDYAEDTIPFTITKEGITANKDADEPA